METRHSILAWENDNITMLLRQACTERPLADRP